MDADCRRQRGIRWHTVVDIFASSEGYMCYCIGQAKLLLFHSCELKCFKPGSSLSSVLFTANIERNRSQTSRRATQSSLTWVLLVCLHDDAEKEHHTPIPTAVQACFELGAGPLIERRRRDEKNKAHPHIVMTWKGPAVDKLVAKKSL